jgi:nucleotide-binding universal stress UspA family protein
MERLYSRILVGIDGSPHGEHALAHAVFLARVSSARLRIVHVVDMGWLPLGTELAMHTAEICRARRAHGEALLAVAADAARKAGVEVEPSLVETSAPLQQVAAVLVSEAAAWRADLMVLGGRGGGQVERMLLGSVADGVARRASVPVLLVH